MQMTLSRTLCSTIIAFTTDKETVTRFVYVGDTIDSFIINECGLYGFTGQGFLRMGSSHLSIPLSM